jgi:eukaryotic-like serine/threonine-protein kinase
VRPGWHGRRRLQQGCRRDFSTGRRLERTVAIKVLAPHLVAEPSAAARVLREVRAAAALSHDHNVTLHAVEEPEGAPYLVMQFVQGESLQQRIERGQPLTVAEIVRLGSEVACRG